MVEIIQAANALTWPAAVAICAVCAAIVGACFAFAWMVK